MNETRTYGKETKLKTLRGLLRARPISQKRQRKQSLILKENGRDDGAISSEFAYIARFDYDNQKVIEQIKKDIMAISKWADVAVSVIAISED